MHVYLMRSKAALRPEISAKTLRGTKVVSRIPRAVEEDSPYVWEAVLS